jgi:preprotein translocase subunit SecF
MRFIRELNINFLGMKYVGFAISSLVIAFCLFYLFTTGITMGIDFAGGHLIRFKYQELPSDDEIRDRLTTVGLSNAIIQSDPQNKDVMIRVMSSDEENLETEQATDSNQDPVVGIVTNALRTDAERENINKGLLDLNIVGTERVTALLMAEDPLNFREQQGLGMSPDEYAEQKYGEAARQLIKQYRDVRHNPEENKYAGLIADIDKALNSITMAGR